LYQVHQYHVLVPPTPAPHRPPPALSLLCCPAGRFLNTPELVPFRLTRNVVDGMGVLGPEGPLRRCSEVGGREGALGLLAICMCT
jgi:hypothetical protein